jgi:hypothetical protein
MRNNAALLLLFFNVYMQSNLEWAPVVGYGSFSLWVIHKKDLCPSSAGINRLMRMMMMMMIYEK